MPEHSHCMCGGRFLEADLDSGASASKALCAAPRADVIVVGKLSLHSATLFAFVAALLGASQAAQGGTRSQHLLCQLHMEFFVVIKETFTEHPEHPQVLPSSRELGLALCGPPPAARSIARVPTGGLSPAPDHVLSLPLHYTELRLSGVGPGSQLLSTPGAMTACVCVCMQTPLGAACRRRWCGGCWPAGRAQSSTCPATRPRRCVAGRLRLTAGWSACSNTFCQIGLRAAVQGCAPLHVSGRQGFHALARLHCVGYLWEGPGGIPSGRTTKQDWC